MKTIGGNGCPTFNDGTYGSGTFDYPSGVAYNPVTPDYIYITDYLNNAIRVQNVVTGVITTLDIGKFNLFYTTT